MASEVGAYIRTSGRVLPSPTCLHRAYTREPSKPGGGTTMRPVPISPWATSLPESSPSGRRRLRRRRQHSTPEIPDRTQARNRGQVTATPYFRQSSFTGTPASACASTWLICSVVRRFSPHLSSSSLLENSSAIWTSSWDSGHLLEHAGR